MKFARESLPFVLPFVLLAALLAAARRTTGALLSALGGLAVLLFFRDPPRRFLGSERALLSPADGRVTQVDTVKDPAVGPGRQRRVVTFLSVFDVHVQKVPASGRVVSSTLTRGKKLAAFKGDVDRHNESHLTVIETDDGERYGVRQIVGLLARRVVCYLEEGDRVERGQPLGLIKFGSRVDLLVPEDHRIVVGVGDRLQNGATVVALRPERAGDRPEDDDPEDDAPRG